MDEALKDKVRQARKRMMASRTKDFPIPGTDKTLWGTFRALDDYSEVRKIGAANAAIGNDATRELYACADSLDQSCIDTFVVSEDGTKTSLGMGLTPALAHIILDDDDDPMQLESNRQAILNGIFPTTVSVAQFAVEIEAWFSNVGAATDVELAGNSPAQTS